MFCFRRSYRWNKTLKQFQIVLELFQSCFSTCRKICKSQNSFRGLSQSPTTTRKRLLQLKQNNTKQFQNKSKTNPKQNKIVLFWDCFSASYMWNKTLKQNKSRRGLSVNQSINFAQQQAATAVSTTLRHMWRHLVGKWRIIMLVLM